MRTHKASEDFRSQISDIIRNGDTKAFCWLNQIRNFTEPTNCIWKQSFVREQSALEELRSPIIGEISLWPNENSLLEGPAHPFFCFLRIAFKGNKVEIGQDMIVIFAKQRCRTDFDYYTRENMVLRIFVSK